MPSGRILPFGGWVWHRIVDRLPGRSASQYSIYHSRFVLSYVACSLQQTDHTCQDASHGPPIIRSFPGPIYCHAVRISSRRNRRTLINSSTKSIIATTTAIHSTTDTPTCTAPDTCATSMPITGNMTSEPSC